MGDLVLDLFQAELELGGGREGLLALRQHVADLDQGEAELLAFQDDGQAGPVAGAVDPLGAGPDRRKQPAVLVEPERPQGNAELAGQVADGVGSMVRGAGFEAGLSLHDSHFRSMPFSKWVRSRPVKPSRIAE